MSEDDIDVLIATVITAACDYVDQSFARSEDREPRTSSSAYESRNALRDAVRSYLKATKP